MKLLVVYQHYHPEPFRISDICESLVKLGHEVTVLTGLPNYPEGIIYDGYSKGERREELINGVKVTRSYLMPRGKNHLMLFLNYISFAFFASIKILKMKEQYDVIYAHQTSPVLMVIPAIIYKRKNNKKILLYCLDPWPDSLAAGGVKEGSFIYRIFKPISKWIYSSADKLMVSSYMFKEYFKTTFGFDSDAIEHLPQYAEDYFTEKVNRTNSEGFNFVFAGNIGKAQSVETIILAANELKARKQFHFHIVGGGSNLDLCKRLAKELKLDNITFHGRQPMEKMKDYYGMASAMLVTLKESKSFSYTLPGKVQTYMAAGKPIIGAANGETRRVIEEAGCGLCCPADDYLGLAAIIVQFFENQNIDQLANNSRAYYDRYFSKERFINTLERALADLGESSDV